MELAQVIIELLVGLVVFVVGMNMMSKGLKETAARPIRKLFKKIKNNSILSMLIGAGTTAIIQSSGATTVMVVGFLSAGALTFTQGFALMTGAFVGTTITGVLVSLSSFSFSIFLMAFAVIGFILTFVKHPVVKSIGEILIGFGILFFGLEAMKAAFSYEAIQSFLMTLLTSVDFPPLLMLLGLAITLLTQSSSATNGIVIMMVISNPNLISSGVYLVIGATIGALFPTFLAAIKANNLAKRVTFSQITNRTLFAILVTVILWIFSGPVFGWLSNFVNQIGLVLALFTVVYNIIFTAVFLPLSKPIDKLSALIIKDKDLEKKKSIVKGLNDSLLKTPPLALLEVKREIENMFNLSFENFTRGVNAIINMDFSSEKEMEETEENIDYINNAISSYLIKVSNESSIYDEARIGSYYHVINDIERIGDHAYNFLQSAKKMRDEELEFSSEAKEEFNQFVSLINVMFDLSKQLFVDKKKKDLTRLHELEEKTDRMKDTLSDAHFKRIKEKKCKNELSPFHSTFVSELERVADHLTNIGYSIVNPTGDETKVIE